MSEPSIDARIDALTRVLAPDRVSDVLAIREQLLDPFTLEAFGKRFIELLGGALSNHAHQQAIERAMREMLAGTLKPAPNLVVYAVIAESVRMDNRDSATLFATEQEAQAWCDHANDLDNDDWRYRVEEQTLNVSAQAVAAERQVPLQGPDDAPGDRQTAATQPAVAGATQNNSPTTC